MRLLSQRIAQRANKEDKETGRFFQDRYRAVRLLDEASLLACAAYVDLNPIRAAMAETLEDSDHTSVQRRIASAQEDEQGESTAHAKPTLLTVGRISVMLKAASQSRTLNPKFIFVECYVQAGFWFMHFER